jgi:hypothetical protein
MGSSGRPIRVVTRILALVLALSVALPGSAATQDPGWPREITRDDATLVYYQVVASDVYP